MGGQLFNGAKSRVYVNTEEVIERIIAEVGGNGTRFECECYDVGHLYNVAYFAERGLLQPPLIIQTVFGFSGGIGVDPGNVAYVRSVADRLFGRDYHWSILAPGRHQFQLCTMGAVFGANVRVGLEDNLYLGKGQLARSNADQVTRMRQILELLSLEVATPDDAREMLGLRGRAEWRLVACWKQFAAACRGNRARYRRGSSPDPKALAQSSKPAQPSRQHAHRAPLRPFPDCNRAGQGGWLHDLDGHAYRDFMNDLTAGLYGHSHPAIIGALKEALDQGISFGAPNLYEDRLAAAICERFRSIEKVRFCNSGTEANLLAVQLARVATGRSKVLGFSSGYHGSLISFVPGLDALNVTGSDVVLARFNDVSSFEQAARAAGSDLAAVIVEPMLGSGGTILAEEQFLAALRALTRELGAVLIFDEVQTARLAYGGRRSSGSTRFDDAWQVLQRRLGVRAVGGRSDLMDRFDPSRPDRIGHGEPSTTTS